MSELSDALAAVEKALATTEKGVLREQAGVCERLRRNCLLLADRITESLHALSDVEENDRAVGAILVPIVSLKIGTEGALEAAANWTPQWRQDVGDACDSINQRLRDRRYGIVDDQGIIHDPNKPLSVAMIRAVLQTLRHAIRQYGIDLMEPDATVQERIARHT